MKRLNQEEVSSRIKRVLDELSISQTRLQNTAMISNISRKMDDSNDKYIWTANDINKICNTFNVSKDYLLYGNGEPIVKENNLRISTKTGKPYYNVDFQLGFDSMENDQTVNPEYMIDCTPYNKCDYWCNARGDSMQPTISGGDIIAIKEVSDVRCLISGEIYAIITTNDLRTIKRVKDNGDTITLIPDNKAYPEQTIQKDMILKVYRVLGCMKVF